MPVRFVFEVEPLADGCLCTMRQEHDAAASFGWTEAAAAEWRRGTREHLERVRDVLATWPQGRPAADWRRC